VPERRLDTDPPGAANSVNVDAAFVGSNLYVVWEDYRSGVADVFFQHSADGGVTWLPQDVRLTTNAPGVTAAVAPRLCASGTYLYVVWQDSRNGAGDVYFRRTPDAGVTWTPQEIRLDSGAAGAAQSGLPQVACNGQNVVVAWQDFRNGLPDVYENRSADGGVTWLPADVRLDTDVAGAAVSFGPVIAMTGADVYVAWIDGRSGLFDIRLNRSGNSGATWLAADVRLDTDVAGSHSSGPVAIAADGAGVVAVWSDDRNGQLDVYANASLDHGASWKIADVRLDTDAAGSSLSTMPSITMTGSAVRVAWLDARTSGGDVRLATSADGGLTWGSDARIDQRPAGTGTCNAPRVCGDTANVFVVWEDTRSGLPDLYYQASLDGGATWMPAEVRLDLLIPGSAASTSPRPVCIGRKLRVVYSDTRAGAADAYFAGSD
jgi:hypothetical protein